MTRKNENRLRFILILLILGFIILLSASCDYNLKTDTELKQYEYRIESAKETTEAVRASVMNDLDSVMVLYQNEKKMRQRLLDSLQWADLRSVNCWESSDHKHSCQEFRSQ